MKKKMKYFNGKAYENYSCNKLCHKIFLEDIAKINSINNNYNQEFLKIFENTLIFINNTNSLFIIIYTPNNIIDTYNNY